VRPDVEVQWRAVIWWCRVWPCRPIRNGLAHAIVCSIVTTVPVAVTVLTQPWRVHFPNQKNGGCRHNDANTLQPWMSRKLTCLVSGRGRGRRKWEEGSSRDLVPESLARWDVNFLACEDQCSLGADLAGDWDPTSPTIKGAARDLVHSHSRSTDQHISGRDRVRDLKKGTKNNQGAPDKNLNSKLCAPRCSILRHP
jgi:hypothetical protein